MAQGVGIGEVAGADGTHIASQHGDAIRTFAPGSGNGGGVLGIARSATEVRSDPDVEVLAPGPIDQILHGLVAFVGKQALRARDPIGAVAVGVQTGEFEGDAHIGHDVEEFRLNLGPIRGFLVVVLVHYPDGIAHLGVGDVLRAIVVDDVEHHRNDVLIAPTRRVRLEMGGEGLQVRTGLLDLGDPFRMAYDAVAHAGIFVVATAELNLLGKQRISAERERASQYQ